MNEFREWLNLFKKHSGWGSTTILLLSAVLGLLMRLNDYLNYNILCFYFNLNIEFYQYNEISIIFTIFIGMILLGLIGSSIYCYNRLLNSLKSKSIQNKISDVILFVLFNSIVVAILYSSYHNVFIAIIATIIFQIVIIGIFNVLKGIDKKINDIQTREEAFEKLKNFLKLLPWLVLMVLIFTAACNYLSYTTKRDYQIIIHDNNEDAACEVVVYATNEYFLTLDCEIEKNNLTIFKDKQTKIKTDNIKTRKLVFNNVVIK